MGRLRYDNDRDSKGQNQPRVWWQRKKKKEKQRNGQTFFLAWGNKEAKKQGRET